MLSIVIPYRNEDMLGFTVQRIRETCRVPHEIIVVDDGSDNGAELPHVEHIHTMTQPIGNCFCRDTGIELARYPTVLVLDAHMNFWDDEWAYNCVEWSTSNPDHIACTVCPQLARDRMGMEDANGRYHGAYLKWADISFERLRALPNKWGPFESPCEVGCILGGAYVMQRQRYMDIGRPWQYMRGWGHSEQIISLVNYLLGGENWILPIEIGHMFRTGQFNQVPYRTQTHNLYYNQQVVIDVCVHDDGDALELRDHIAPQTAWACTPEGHEPVVSIQQMIERMLEAIEVPQYAQWVRDRTVQSWRSYWSKWIEPYMEVDK